MLLNVWKAINHTVLLALKYFVYTFCCWLRKKFLPSFGLESHWSTSRHLILYRWTILRRHSVHSINCWRIYLWVLSKFRIELTTVLLFIFFWRTIPAVVKSSRIQYKKFHNLNFYLHRWMLVSRYQRSKLGFILLPFFFFFLLQHPTRKNILFWYISFPNIQSIMAIGQYSSRGVISAK